MSLEMMLRAILHAALATASLVTPTHRLVEQILGRPYDTDVRPRKNPTDITYVTIVPNMFILLRMDQQQETIQFLEEFMLTWNDPAMGWNQSDTDYPKDWIKVHEARVWTPDVIFDDAISIDEMIDLDQRMLDMKHDGTLRQSSPSVVEFPCPLKIEQFPYDQQICNVTIGPWNFDSRQVVVKRHEATITPVDNRYEGNSEWELEIIEVIEEEEFDALQDLSYSYLTFQVKLKRKPVYYVLVIQAPTFIVSTLTIFGLFTPFNQEFERREKVTLGLNMFVSISMMLNLVSEMMPKASRLPLLGNYILAEIFVGGIGVVVAMVTLTVHEKCHTRLLRPPRWVLRLVLLQCSSKIDMDEAENKENKEVELQTLNDSKEIQPLRGLHTAFAKASAALQGEIDYHDSAHEIRLLWAVIFDRIDLICLILFQLFNVIASALFMR